MALVKLFCHYRPCVELKSSLGLFTFYFYIIYLLIYCRIGSLWVGSWGLPSQYLLQGTEHSLGFSAHLLQPWHSVSISWPLLTLTISTNYTSPFFRVNICPLGPWKRPAHFTEAAWCLLDKNDLLTAAGLQQMTEVSSASPGTFSLANLGLLKELMPLILEIIPSLF